MTKNLQLGSWGEFSIFTGVMVGRRVVGGDVPRARRRRFRNS